MLVNGISQAIFTECCSQASPAQEAPLELLSCSPTLFCPSSPSCCQKNLDGKAMWWALPSVNYFPALFPRSRETQYSPGPLHVTVSWSVEAAILLACSVSDFMAPISLPRQSPTVPGAGLPRCTQELAFFFLRVRALQWKLVSRQSGAASGRRAAQTLAFVAAHRSASTTREASIWPALLLAQCLPSSQHTGAHTFLAECGPVEASV